MILFFFMGGGDMFAQRPRNVGRLPLFFLSNIACTVEDCGLGGTSQCSSGLRPRHTSIPSPLISSVSFLQLGKISNDTCWAYNGCWQAIIKTSIWVCHWAFSSALLYMHSVCLIFMSGKERYVKSKCLQRCLLLLREKHFFLQLCTTLNIFSQIFARFISCA